MGRFLPAILLAACLVLGYCYGAERADGAKREARITALRHRADSLDAISASRQAEYARTRSRADSLAASARVRVVYRDRAVASTDSALARVDSLLPTLPDTTARLVSTLLSTIRAERLLSSSAIASLSTALEAKDAALAASDSLIASLRSQIAASSELISEYRKLAHPSLLVRTGRFLRHAAIGAAAMAVFVMVR